MTTRFPRAKCGLCGHLCLLRDVAKWLMVRVADDHSKVVTLCAKCADEMPLQKAFKIVRLLDQ
jgi:hypothetical protein